MTIRIVPCIWHTERSYSREHVLAVDTGRGYPKRFSVLLIPEGGEGRQEYMGPMVPGPWATAVELGVTLAAQGGTYDERQARLAAGTEHDVEDGDWLELEGDPEGLYHIGVSRPYGKIRVTLTRAKD